MDYLYNLWIKNYVYEIRKAIFPPGSHHNGFVASHALGHVMYIMCTTIMCTTANHLSKCMTCYKATVTTGRAHCFHDCI